MPLSDFEAAERRLSQFAEFVRAGDEGRSVATLDADLEAMVDAANGLFDVISDVDTQWHFKVHGEELPYSQTELNRITTLYQEWFEASEALLALLEAQPGPLRRISEHARFQSNLNEARGILTPDDQFFNDEALTPRQDEALEAHRRGETVEFEDMGD